MPFSFLFGTFSCFFVCCNFYTLYRADPTATTVKNPKLPERWAYEHNHVGVLVELAKVKEVEPDIMSSSLGELVQKEEERERRRRKDEEEREWRREMLEQQQEWQKEVVGILKQHNLDNLPIYLITVISDPMIFDRWLEC